MGRWCPTTSLRISGEEAVQQYLVHEIQQVYRSQRVDINDKHIEIIIARMLRKVRIENPGDTSLLPGLEMDRFEFRTANEQLAKCRKISDPGDTPFGEAELVPKERLEEANAESGRAGRQGRQGLQAQARHRQHPAAGHHQGLRAELELHLGGQLPGDHQSAHRGRRWPARSTTWWDSRRT